MLNSLLLVLATSAATTPPQPPATPFACRANALDKAQRQRQQALLDKVRGMVLGSQELPNGILLTFPAEESLFRDLAEWVSLERRCCPFFGFTLEWNQDDVVSVHLTGQPGIKQVIAAEMGLGVER